jgi:SpoVK/Ycf46/Vps4 family AAA+-type ATPase
MPDIERDFVHLARLALTGQRQDVLLLIRRSLPSLAKTRPDLATELGDLIAGTGLPSRANNNIAEPIPVDLDSRLELLRREDHPVMPVQPTWPESIRNELSQICEERAQLERLNAAGIMPTRSMLFIGPPGVGKSLAARYLACELQRPLLTLDLAAVMSSFLGRTGNNIRAVLDFARRGPSVLLLDEFDAIAKRRDDSTEIGELKRLVTVLLQAIDDWPPHGILIAATNHPDLLDPAVWRRFERLLKFDVPASAEIRKALEIALSGDKHGVSSQTVTLLSYLLRGRSFAEIDRTITAARRDSAISDTPVSQILDQLSKSLFENLDHAQRIELANCLHREGFTQYEAKSITGVSRDTIRKYAKAAKSMK